MRRLALALALLLGASRAAAEPELGETRLPLRLVGTVVSASAERSLAVIESGGATRVVRAGESIGGARVEAIGKDAVVLAQAGRRERLSFGAPGSSSASAATTTAGELARAHGSGGRDADGLRDQEPRARAASRAPSLRGRPAARRPGVRAASLTKPRTNDEVIADISRQARFQPLLDDAGKLRGVALLGIVPDSMLERFGLQSGDVVTHVAGVKIDNTANAYNTLRDLNLANGVALTVVRRGAPTTVNVPAGAF